MSLKSPGEERTTSGYLAEARYLTKVGAWDNNFFRFEDFDFTLRISQHGTLLQLPEFIGIHHTQVFNERSWAHFRNGYPLYYGRLLRKNFDRPYFTIRLLRGNRGLATFLLLNIVLMCGLGAAALSSFTLSYVVLVGLLCVSLDCAYSTLVKRFKINQWLLHNYLEAPMILYGVFRKPKSAGGQTTVNII